MPHKALEENKRHTVRHDESGMPSTLKEHMIVLAFNEQVTCCNK
jgi:hypothetical protein